MQILEIMQPFPLFSSFLGDKLYISSIAVGIPLPTGFATETIAV